MDLKDENIQVLNLVQALIGAISPNLRRVTIQVVSPEHIHLRFLLENESVADREELADVVFEFETLQTSDIEIETEILIDARPLEETLLPGRVVFGRKE